MKQGLKLKYKLFQLWKTVNCKLIVQKMRYATTFFLKGKYWELQWTIRNEHHNDNHPPYHMWIDNSGIGRMKLKIWSWRYVNIPRAKREGDKHVVPKVKRCRDVWKMESYILPSSSSSSSSLQFMLYNTECGCYEQHVIHMIYAWFIYMWYMMIYGYYMDDIWMIYVSLSFKHLLLYLNK